MVLLLSPVTGFNLIYVSSELGRIFCLEAASGKVKWTVDMTDDLGGKLNMFGNSESLFVDEKNVYCMPGGDHGTGAYKLQLSPDGKTIHEIWRNGDVLNALGGFVKIGDRLYCASKDHKLKCLDTNNGMVVDSLPNMSGSVIYAD